MLRFNYLILLLQIYNYYLISFLQFLSFRADCLSFIIKFVEFSRVSNDFSRMREKSFCRLFELFCFFCCYFVAQNKIQD